jgi:prolyl-tRNA synthetase
VLDENGKLVTVTMGSYGIGVSRAVAAIAESTHDELGLVWPREVAPGRRARRRHRQGRRGVRGRRGAGQELVAAGLTVLYDDRPKVSPGVKFKDAELLGMPTIVTVGAGWPRASGAARPGDGGARGGAGRRGGRARVAAVRG